MLVSQRLKGAFRMPQSPRGNFKPGEFLPKNDENPHQLMLECCMMAI